jgi:hypothetical protein
VGPSLLGDSLISAAGLGQIVRIDVMGFFVVGV